MTPEILADKILNAAGSALRNYKAKTKFDILVAATHLLPHAIDDIKRASFKKALMDLQRFQEWRKGGSYAMMQPREIGKCIDKAIEAMKILTEE